MYLWRRTRESIVDKEGIPCAWCSRTRAAELPCLLSPPTRARAGYPRAVNRAAASLLYSLFAALASLGCGSAELEAEAPESAGDLGDASVSCYRPFQPGPDPAADLALLTTACAKHAGLKAVTPVHVGEPQTAEASAERFSFLGRAGRCYRIFAVAAPEITDLDVALLDDDGRIAAADASRDRWPIVPPRGELCLYRDERFTVQVGVVDGSGGYVMQVWGSSPSR